MKIKNNRKIAAFILLAAWTSSSEAVIESCALFKKGNKKVLILGDVHTTGQDPQSVIVQLDIRDSNIVMPFIEKFADNPVKTNIILEGSEEDLTHKEQMLGAGYEGMVYALPYYARKHGYHSGNTLFTLGDMRRKSVYNIVDFLSGVLSSPLKDPELLYQHKDMLKKALGRDDSLNDFFRHIKITLKSFDKAVQDSNSPEAVMFIKQTLGVVKDYRKKAKAKFDLNQLNTSFVDVFAQLAKNEKSIEPLVEHLFSWILPLTDAIADMGFMLKLAKSLEEYNQVIVFSGNNHAVALHHFLRFNDFTELYVKGLAEKTQFGAFFVDSRFGEEELTSLLNAAFENTEPRTTLKICASCAEKECTTRCSQCKSVYYCSRKCQSKDWYIHKHSCKKETK